MKTKDKIIAFAVLIAAVINTYECAKKFKRDIDNWAETTTIAKNINVENIILVDDYDSIYSMISNGYANGFLIKEYINSNFLNDNILNFNIPDCVSSIKMGILYNINNEIKIKNYFNA